jgi:hypothetical protein
MCQVLQIKLLNISFPYSYQLWDTVTSTPPLIKLKNGKTLRRQFDFFSFLFFVVLEFEPRVFTLSHSTNSFFVMGFFLG